MFFIQIQQTVLDSVFDDILKASSLHLSHMFFIQIQQLIEYTKYS